jgi:alanyl-tRNA synthetase
MKTAEIRKAFLNYFQKHGHVIIPSYPLVPANDPTLLFTTAGMVQFKDMFLGLEHRTYTRATSIQRCFRANDLDNVGYTARHHTFFEMLGNFSFGDYFKREAIQYAWNFLTEVLAISPKKLWITVYKTDDETANIWINEIGIDPNRLSRLGDDDNFWAMGDTGPCGPSSEIFYDHGEEVFGGPPGSPDEDGDRYVEIWNIVFMQFNRDVNGNLTPLDNQSIDTGSGLERLAAVMQGVHSNYDIDIFQHLIKAAAKTTRCDDLTHPSLKVISDHIRATGFLIMDGILPSNEKRGYVLRRIMRRAIRHGYKLGIQEPFFHKLVNPLIEIMGHTYRDLQEKKTIIEQIILKEEEQFFKTLDQGTQLFEQAIKTLKGKVVPGEIVFKLYDTYGFPADLTEVMAEEFELTIDQAGFDKAMSIQQARSKAASRFKVDYDERARLEESSTFTGYEQLSQPAKILAILKKGELSTKTLAVNEMGGIILDTTPFYAESGGQVGDSGQLESKDRVFQVESTQKKDNAIIHWGKMVKGAFTKDDTVQATVDEARRYAIASNHTATHLLHAALRRVLGGHIIQRGSLVEAKRLRLDFSHHQPVTHEELAQVEKIVNGWIRENVTTRTDIMSPSEAQKKGAMALFGEKYGEQARVLTIGLFSAELCGGTHIGQLGQIGLFKITSETGIAANVRRIEAVTGEQAIQYIQNEETMLRQISDILHAQPTTVVEKLTRQIEGQKDTEAALNQTKQQLLPYLAHDLIAGAKNIEGITFIAVTINELDSKGLRSLIDHIQSLTPKTVVILANHPTPQKTAILVGISQDCPNPLSAKLLLQHIAPIIDGKGGGKKDIAQGGGTNPQKLNAAFAEAEKWLIKQMMQ